MGLGPERLHLIFDADDTLWEANILFERAIDDFITWIAHPTLDPVSIRATLHDIEAANSVAHGYGTRVFLRSLHECFEHLLERPPTSEDQARIEALAAPLLAHEIEPIDDVEETLVALGTRHDLLLLTKGDEREQQSKIVVSGLGDHFRRIVIVPEKTTEVYVRLVETERLDPARTWMIGNSPKSDINPALGAGLNAVYVPHERTWHLEKTELATGPGQLLKVARFANLREVF